MERKEKEGVIVYMHSCDTCRYFSDRDKTTHFTDICRQNGSTQISKVKKIDIAIQGCAVWKGN